MRPKRGISPGLPSLFQLGGSTTERTYHSRRGATLSVNVHSVHPQFHAPSKRSAGGGSTVGGERWSMVELEQLREGRGRERGGGRQRRLEEEEGEEEA